MGGDGRILLDVDSGDFAIIVPNTKFLMFYNCFGYLYYSICSPREERLGIFAIYIININLLYQSQSPRALEPLKDTNKIGYTYQLHTARGYDTRHSLKYSVPMVPLSVPVPVPKAAVLLYDIIFSLLDSAAPSLSLVYWCQYCCCCYSDSSNSDYYLYLT